MAIPPPTSARLVPSHPAQLAALRGRARGLRDGWTAEVIAS
ncbi:hypothetical protein [Curtobacterium sp. ISL-83]|nr:hypothetical protein [Curtobacterium sp. ISL-83]